MYFVLRVIRGFCGFVFALQALHVVQSIVWLLSNGTSGVDIGKFMALLLIKVIVLAISGALFFGLRWLINRLHSKMKGCPHPSLAEKRWAL
ncbi:hypothetical protein A3754_01230 [Alcanivorax sp. HI0083]|uniref:hypothetical protein n=1 Tax=unclassified Alcanivorax TaxID=2638842 RepID=UPI0007B7DD2A|nr:MULTISPECIES: hypothetical protein [unclassified Alcanivorax]KZY36774.1 hypothetical protein A3730_12520 [Alcanivorax sp. HI0044]KZZ27281.1 hypothetical protein A3754_01230 [Alcanivorax sp. HI0083]